VHCQQPAAARMPGRKIVSPKLDKSDLAPVELFRNEFVQVVKDAEHPVATAWLDRAEKRNALGAQVLAAIECVPRAPRLLCCPPDA
jgi:hypothetical protein